jgi:hypothetical protein
MPQPEHDRGRPGERRPLTSLAGDAPILLLRGCPCGCVAGVDCVTNRIAPAPSTCWDCAGIPVDKLARGVGCSPAHSTPNGIRWMRGAA